MMAIIYILALLLGIHGPFFLGIRRERQMQERLFRSALLSLVHNGSRRRGP